MAYAKPELVCVGPAIEAVRGEGKPGGHLDSDGELSSGAYEADE